jgi:hypothetical protein
MQILSGGISDIVLAVMKLGSTVRFCSEPLYVLIYMLYKIVCSSDDMASKDWIINE